MKQKHRFVALFFICGIIYVCNMYINAINSKRVLQKGIDRWNAMNKKSDKKVLAESARIKNIPDLKDFDRFDLIQRMKVRDKGKSLQAIKDRIKQVEIVMKE